MSEFNFKTNNCYTLANQIRIENGLKPLPDYFDYMHNSEQEPIGFIASQLKLYACQKYELKNFYLLLLTTSLATYFNEQIHCMTEKGHTILPIKRTVNLITSIWEY